MSEPHRTLVGIPVIDLLTAPTGSGGGTAAPSPASRRGDGRLLAQMASARSRRLPPPARSLPRRGGY
ncbi:hypothetical protein [Streptomyces cellulosae]|uniref:hypothetical protein n=1 Tax=Streptomyces cellulosae TaxID=1968 RepID=UPI0004CB6D09|nr:hypothetical protein [Streptomyces cellulosae]